MKINKDIFLIEKELDKKQIKLIENYENFRTRKKFQCKLDHVWNCTVYDILERQHSCPTCGELRILNNDIIDQDLIKLNQERLETNGARKNESIKRIGKYIALYSKIEWECLVDQNIWLSTPHDILYRGVGCPLCHVKSETIVYLALKNVLNTPIKRQLFLCNYEYLSKIREAFCDFYFELNNKKYIIEYNGAQHYKPIKFSPLVSDEAAQAKLEKQQYRDNVVKKYCENNDIELFIIDGTKISGEKKVKIWVDELSKKI